MAFADLLKRTVDAEWEEIWEQCISILTTVVGVHLHVMGLSGQEPTVVLARHGSVAEGGLVVDASAARQPVHTVD